MPQNSSVGTRKTITRQAYCIKCLYKIQIECNVFKSYKFLSNNDLEGAHSQYRSPTPPAFSFKVKYPFPLKCCIYATAQRRPYSILHKICTYVLLDFKSMLCLVYHTQKLFSKNTNFYVCLTFQQFFLQRSNFRVCDLALGASEIMQHIT